MLLVRSKRAALGFAAFAVAVVGVTPLIAIRVTRARLDALEARLASEIEAELRRPPERLPVLRGTPREGDALEAVARALRTIAPGDSTTREWAEHELASFGAEPRWTERLESVRAPLAPAIGALREAMACESARVPYIAISRCPSEENALRDDVRARWTSLDVATDEIDRARLAIDLETARALACGAAHEAARVWADGRRLDHVIARLDNWCGSSRPWRYIPLEGAIVARLDEPGLAAFDAELARLEESVPSYARALRRERLDFGRALAARRASKQLYVINSWEEKPPRSERILGSLTAEYQVWRGWERLDAALGELERQAPAGPPYDESRRLEALRALEACMPPHCPERVRLRWSPSNGNVQSVWLCDAHLAELAHLRVVRASIASVRFHRAKGRWPTSQAEALGRDPRTDELDPLTDGPFRVDGSQVRSSLRSGRDTTLDHEDLYDADGWYLGASLAVAPPPATVVEETASPLSLELAGVSPRDAVAAITSRTGRTVLCLATGFSSESAPISLSLRDVSWVNAISAVASAARCDVLALPGGTVALDAQPRVTIQFTQADSHVLIQLLAAYAGRTLVTVGELADARAIDVDIVDVDWRVALERLLRDDGYLAVDVVERSLFLRHASRGSAHPVNWRHAMLRVPQPEAIAATRPRVTLREKRDQSDARDGSDLARRLGLPLFVAPGALAGIDLDLRNVPWEDAVAALALLTRGAIEQRGGSIRLVHTEVSARDCPAGILLPLIGRHAARDVSVSRRARDIRLSFDLVPCSLASDAFRSVAFAHGLSIEATEERLLVKMRDGFRVDDAPRSDVDIEQLPERIRAWARRLVARVGGRLGFSAVVVEPVAASSSAVINERVFHAGDEIAPGLKLVRVIDRGVVLTLDGEEGRLYLN